MLIIKEDDKHFTMWLDEIDFGELTAIQTFLARHDSSVQSKHLNVEHQMSLDTEDMATLMFQFEVIKVMYEKVMKNPSATAEDKEQMQAVYDLTKDFVEKLVNALK
jgi:uncharacterized protein (UPF0276 family)